MFFKRFNLFLAAIYILISFENLNAQSLQEIEKLKNEYKKVLERQSLQKSPDIEEAENRASSTALPDKLVYSRKDVESLLVNTQNLLEELKFIKDSSSKMQYAGYEIFTKRDSIPFWQNLPVPKNYKLGPGDEVVISLWGEVNLYVNETINREGQIYIENVGILNLSDKTINDAQAYTLKRFSRLYSTLLGNNPKTFMDLSIGDLKSLNVHFVGFVNIPGVHMVHPFSNIISSLSQAGGVSSKGSLRKIQLIRNGEVITTLDIYDYIFYGKSVSDIRLLDQDIIYIPPRLSTISIDGRVQSPGYFEALPNEKLENIINFAGGLDFKSSEYAFVFERSKKSNKSYFVAQNSFEDFNISNGDSVFIPENLENLSFIEVGGRIKNPGRYPFQEKMTIKDLILLTQSTNDKDFFESIDLSKIVITRQNINGKNPLRIVTNYEDKSPLKNKDKINVGVKLFNKQLNDIYISGEILHPGLYSLNASTTLGELLELAGGYTENALDKGIEIFRDSLKIAWQNDSFLLKDMDSLNVLSKSGLVLIDGQLNSPGYISYNRNYSVKKYINLAGGFNSFANKKDVYIIYPNGISKPVSKWKSPKVVEGSTIVVNERLISSQNDNSTGWAGFTAFTSQASSIITTLLSLALIANQTNAN